MNDLYVLIMIIVGVSLITIGLVIFRKKMNSIEAKLEELVRGVSGGNRMTKKLENVSELEEITPLKISFESPKIEDKTFIEIGKRIEFPLEQYEYWKDEKENKLIVKRRKIRREKRR